MGEIFSITHGEKDVELSSLNFFPKETEKILNIFDLLCSGNENCFQFLEKEKMMNNTENQKKHLEKLFSRVFF